MLSNSKKCFSLCKIFSLENSLHRAKHDLSAAMWERVREEDIEFIVKDGKELRYNKLKTCGYEKS